METIREQFESGTGNNDDAESALYCYAYKVEYIKWLEEKVADLDKHNDDLLKMKAGHVVKLEGEIRGVIKDLNEILDSIDTGTQAWEDLQGQIQYLETLIGGC